MEQRVVIFYIKCCLQFVFLFYVSLSAPAKSNSSSAVTLFIKNASASQHSRLPDTSNSVKSIICSFKNVRKVNYVKFTPNYYTGTAARASIDFTIYYYSNNTWHLIRSFAGFTIPQRQPVITSLPLAVHTSKIKITGTKAGTDKNNRTFRIVKVTAGYDAGFEHFTFAGNDGSFQQNRINNVMAGYFNPDKMSHWSADDRNPLIAAKQVGYRNIYAPYAVANGSAWNIYFGGWDGTTDLHDKISITVTMDSFKTMNQHIQVIGNGTLDHVNNETIVKRADGSWLMTYTGKLLWPSLNKPFYAVSSDGVNWTPNTSSSDTNFIRMNGYSNWNNADVNGSNVVLYDNNTYYLYFTDFNSVVNGHRNNVHYATSTDNVNYTYQGEALHHFGIANDIKKFIYNGTPCYLMGLHSNGPGIYYTISDNPRNFPSGSIFFTEANQYITSLSFVFAGNHLYGILYGGGSAITLDQNSIKAKWLTKKIIFISDGTGARWGDIEYAHGPNQVVLLMNTNIETGRFYVYDTDGSALLYTSPHITMKSGDIWNYNE